MTSRAELTVVVPSVNGLPILLECLEALRADAAGGVTIEMLVVDRCGAELREIVRDRFPEATLLPVDRRTTIPAMRAAAFAKAQAPAVAVIEDHVLVPLGWARQMLDALAGGHDVVGGGIRNAAVDRLVDRAAFLCEYSHLLPPLHAGEVKWLTGNNVVYRKALLERYRTVLDAGRWEDHLHAAMRRDGVRLLCRPGIVVGHKMHYRVGDYLEQRFFYARAFAGMDRGGNMARAILEALARVALPPVLLGRIAARTLAARRQRLDFVLGLPLLALFVVAWAAGEMVGYVAGPGDALSRVR